MEDTLGVWWQRISCAKDTRVLILVLMEDTLGVFETTDTYEIVLVF